MSDWVGTVTQDGMTVVRVYSPNEERCRRETAHYAMVYAQDGDVKVAVRKPRNRKP